MGWASRRGRGHTLPPVAACCVLNHVSLSISGAKGSASSALAFRRSFLPMRSIMTSSVRMGLLELPRPPCTGMKRESGVRAFGER